MPLKPRPEYLPALFNPGRSHVGYESEESHPFLYEDFLGDALDRKWAVHTFNDGQADMVSGQAGGVFHLDTSPVAQVETASVFMSNQYCLDLHRGLVFEFRARFRGSSAGNLIPAQIDIVAGVAWQHHSTSDSIQRSAWFRWEEAETTLLETNDTSNDLDDVLTGLSLNGDPDLDKRWVTYKIDFEYMNDVRFYIDGKRLLGQTSASVPVTMDMSNMTDSQAIFQPLFKMRKLGGNGQATLELDYVKAWHRRGQQT